MAARFALNQVALLVLALPVCLGAAARAQSLSVQTVDEQLQIRASQFSFLNGDPLARLKDGRSLRVEFTLMVLPAPGRTAVVTVRRLFGLSYDLWEERLAVTTVESPRRTISHLTAAAAEAWCLEQVTVPLSALGSLRGPEGSFWIRLEYRIPNADDGAGNDDGAGFTLQGLIDVLSRRHRTASEGDVIEDGPFRLPHAGGLSRVR